jgi:hypothetical protein
VLHEPRGGCNDVVVQGQRRDCRSVHFPRGRRGSTQMRSSCSSPREAGNWVCQHPAHQPADPAARSGAATLAHHNVRLSSNERSGKQAHLTVWNAHAMFVGCQTRSPWQRGLWLVLGSTVKLKQESAGMKHRDLVSNPDCSIKQMIVAMQCRDAMIDLALKVKWKGDTLIKAWWTHEPCVLLLLLPASSRITTALIRTARCTVIWVSVHADAFPVC